jgi:hypothetical protein
LFLVTERAYARARPTVPASGDLAGAVQDRRDRGIGHLTSQNANEFDDISTGGPAGLASFVLLYIEPGVVSAVPMNECNDRTVCYIDNDLRDQQPNDFLARLHGHARIVPGAREVLTKRHQFFTVGRTETGPDRAVELRQIVFERAQ